MHRIFRRALILVSLAGAIVITWPGYIISLFSIYFSQKGPGNFEVELTWPSCWVSR